jgi:nitrite reductase/ring-hydroxylating ferredoxin subunit
MPLRTLSALDARARGSVPRYALPAADGASIDRDNEVILVRWQNAVYAFALACPHQHVALRWLEGDGRFQCPKHRSKYRPDGTFIEGRATRGLDRFAVTRDGASVAVDLDALHQQDKDPAGWSAAVLRLA